MVEVTKSFRNTKKLANIAEASESTEGVVPDDV